MFGDSRAEAMDGDGCGNAPNPHITATGGRHMLGVIAWSGVYEGRPAITLSYCGGAALWVYDVGWKREASGNNQRDLHEALGISDSCAVDAHNALRSRVAALEAENATLKAEVAKAWHCYDDEVSRGDQFERIIASLEADLTREKAAKEEIRG